MVLLGLLVGACSAYDPTLLGSAPLDATSDSGQLDGSPDGQVLPDTGMGEDSGTDDGGINPNLCRPGLDSDCPMICPETCNGVDDDCNGTTDDGDARTLCVLDNAEALCVAGACLITACTDTFSNCDQTPGNGCEAQLNSPEHCMVCFNDCTYPNANGQCLNNACAFDDCIDGFGNCDGDTQNGCERPTISVDNCGGCDIVCAPVANGSVGCIDGACGVATCDNGFGDCDGDPANGCETDVLSNVNDCGTCDNVCMFATSAASCSAGFCVPGTCVGGQADCDGQPGNACEANILTDEANCGSCGAICAASQFANAASAECVNGTCAPLACAVGFDDCDGDPANGCETSLRTTSDCNACATACSFPNAAASCSTGVCQIGNCNPLFGNCDNNAANGCERATNTLTDCGTCNTACSVMSGTASCASGVCSIANCASPLADCNGLITDNCEVNTNTSMAHCGSCNNACSPSATNGTRTCNSGQCVLSCAAGFGDCDGNAQNGCETALNSLSNCAACGTTCSFPNAAASCATGSCQLGACNTGFDNCTSAAGCETPLNSLANCNGCGDACNLANATEACVSGSCNLTQCANGFGNCNNMASDGCELALNTLTNCNGCGVACNLANATESCATQTCRVTQCSNGFDNCDGLDANGCEAAINTPANCGGCGMVCDFANATETCPASTCTFGACNSGFASCDNNQGNGCETALTTITDCGGCNVACTRANATTTCATGSCAIQQCSTGFDNCDGNAANGCEQVLGSATNCGACGDTCAIDETCTNFSCRGQFPYTPSNFDPTGITHTAATTLACGVTIFNSQTLAFTNWCSGQPMPSVTTRTQSGGPDVVVLGFDTLTVAAANTFKLEGDKPVILAVFGDANIAGTINASATDNTSGPSGVACDGTSGIHDADSDDGSSGGGGGGFAVAGGSSGSGDLGASGVAGGAVAGNAQLVPLRGGCRGGIGGGSGAGREGGGAGGAVQLSVGGTLTVTGVIAAAGGGGRKGANHEDGGGGGGSGGAVLLEGNAVTILSTAWLTANGGGAAGGNNSDNANGNNGANGSINTGTPASGGTGVEGGDGGRGAASGGGVGNGGGGTCAGLCLLQPRGAGGGGGGGGTGRIRVRGQATCSIAGNNSPAGSYAGSCTPPESNCVGRAHNGRSYWFCPSTVGWVTASGLCQMSGMRLVHINDMAENDFVDTNTTAVQVAIGASDSGTEGVWRWENNNEQFWMGINTGAAVGGLFTRWNTGEPNDSGANEDCGYLRSADGTWNDDVCSVTTPYVCESQ